MERFRATPALRVRNVEDGALVFDPLSWDVHLLNPAAALVLRAVMSECRSAAQIADILQGAQADADSATVHRWTDTAVDELESLGLIEREAADEDR